MDFTLHLWYTTSYFYKILQEGKSMTYYNQIFHHILLKNHSPLFKKYYILFKLLDLIIHKLKFNLYYRSHLGRKPYSRIALLKAFIIKHLEGYKFTSQLVQLLKNNPEIAYLCGFHDSIPDDAIFYRFLNNSQLYKNLYPIFTNIVLYLFNHNIISTSILAVDSKPVKAYTKFNNTKFFNPACTKSPHNLCKKSNRNSQATLSFFSKNLDDNKNSFFWGYRIHVVTTAEGIPIAFEITKNNIPDYKVALKIIKKIKQHYKNIKFKLLLGDSAYDINKFYNYVFNELGAIPLTPKNKRNSNSLNNNNNSIICPAGLEMKFNGFVKEPHRCRMKFRCPIKIANKKEAKNLPHTCPICHHKFIKGKKYGCTRYIDPNSLLRKHIHSSCSLLFKLIYHKRKAVELSFSTLQNLNIENPTHFYLNSIRNFISISYIAQSLIALAAGVVLNDLAAVRRYKHFATNAPPLDKLKFHLAD